MMMATQHDVYLCKKQQQQKFIGLVFSLVCLCWTKKHVIFVVVVDAAAGIE